MTVGLTFTNHNSSPIYEEAGSSAAKLPGSYGLRITFLSRFCSDCFQFVELKRPASR